MHCARPLTMMVSRWQSASASSIECVVRMRLRFFATSSRVSQHLRRAAGSMPLLGSSRKSTFGSPMSAMPRLSLRLLPPL